MYSFSYLEPVSCSKSSSNCCFLTCIQVSQEAVQVVWYSHLFQNFPQFIVIHTVKDFGIVSKAEIDVFLEQHVLLFWWSSRYWQFDLWFLCMDIWNFSFDVLLKPGLENFEHYFDSVWDECNCAVVQTFFGMAILWDWNENWPWNVLLQHKKYKNNRVWWSWSNLFPLCLISYPSLSQSDSTFQTYPKS